MGADHFAEAGHCIAQMARTEFSNMGKRLKGDHGNTPEEGMHAPVAGPSLCYAP